MRQVIGSARPVSFLLTLLLIVGAAAGCEFIGGTDLPGVPDTVRDTTPDDPDDSGQDLPDLDVGRVRVEVVNPTALDARFTVRMDVLGRAVHFADRDLPAGDTQVVVGPDDADRVNVTADFVSLADDVPQTGTFRFGQEFNAGDTIRFVLVAPEPNEPNEPNDPNTGNPGPLLVNAELAADQTVEAGESTVFTVSVIGVQAATRITALADPDAAQNNGNELTIIANAPTAGDDTIEWNTTGVALGLYRLYAEASDAPRFARSEYAVGTVQVIAVASVALLDLDETVEVDAGDQVAFRASALDFVAGATMDVLADPDDTPASGNEIVVAADIPAAAEAHVSWDTTGVAPGDYRLYADLTNAGRLKRSPATGGLVRILAPLALGFVGLDEDTVVAPGDAVEFSVSSANARAGATIDVTATKLEDPNFVVEVASDVPAAALVPIVWDTTHLPDGTYRISASLADGVRGLAAEAVGRVTLLTPLGIELTEPAEDTLLEYEQELVIRGVIAGSIPEQSSLAFFARLADEPNLPATFIGEAAATAEFQLDFTPDGENIGVGTYEIEVRLVFGEGTLASDTAPGLVTIVSPLTVAVSSLFEPVLVERGDELEVEVTAFGQGSEGLLSLYAVPHDPNLPGDPNDPPPDPNATPDPNAPESLLIAGDVPAEQGHTLIPWDTSDFDPGLYRVFAVLTDGPRTRVSRFAPAGVIIAPTLAIRIENIDPNSTFSVGQDVDFKVAIDRFEVGGEVTVVATPEGGDPNSEGAWFVAGFAPAPLTPVTWLTGNVPPGRWSLWARLEANDGRKRLAGPRTINIVPVPDCVGDADGDLDVDLDDLLIVLTYFGSPEPPQGDVTGDGRVDLDDLLAVLGSFGLNCNP